MFEMNDLELKKLKTQAVKRNLKFLRENFSVCAFMLQGFFIAFPIL